MPIDWCVQFIGTDRLPISIPTNHQYLQLHVMPTHVGEWHMDRVTRCALRSRLSRPGRAHAQQQRPFDITNMIFNARSVNACARAAAAAAVRNISQTTLFIVSERALGCALGREDKFDCLPDAHTCSLARRPARLWLYGSMDGWMDRIVALTRVHPSRVRTG